MNMRARDLGIPFDGVPGKFNAITDVEGVSVGQVTISKGDGKLVLGKGPIRTGITTVLPLSKVADEVFAAIFSYNGNGEMTGSHWIEESGHLKGPISITNTHSVGVVRDAVIEWMVNHNLFRGRVFWGLPVVAETYDGLLNDINGFHVKKEHVFNALNNSSAGDVVEGNIGGGTGMICHQFKGGIGTSSRKLSRDFGNYTLGVLVQANYGIRSHLTIAGVPVGKEMASELLPEINASHETLPEGKEGSIIAVVATDAPLLPYQLKRIAKRVTAGLARVGGYGHNGSGDIFIAFSTANKLDSADREVSVKNYKSLNDNCLDFLFKATAEATEEAIVNALISAETMKGINDNLVYSLPHNRLIEILQKYNRLENSS